MFKTTPCLRWSAAPPASVCSRSPHPYGHSRGPCRRQSAKQIERSPQRQKVHTQSLGRGLAALGRSLSPTLRSAWKGRSPSVSLIRFSDVRMVPVQSRRAALRPRTTAPARAAYATPRPCGEASPLSHSRRALPGSSRRSRQHRSIRRGPCVGTAGGSPPHSKTARRARSPWLSGRNRRP
jgi:hypothetical protein